VPPSTSGEAMPDGASVLWGGGRGRAPLRSLRAATAGEVPLNTDLDSLGRERWTCPRVSCQAQDLTRSGKSACSDVLPGSMNCLVRSRRFAYAQGRNERGAIVS
jgi:hypothetical protein